MYMNRASEVVYPLCGHPRTSIKLSGSKSKQCLPSTAAIDAGYEARFARRTCRRYWSPVWHVLSGMNLGQTDSHEYQILADLGG
ncbi:uncharacterized protein PITG_02140 [Phytophthora infestans T30-4]|uniref:Uncharacterized protein n=1 Tax=Phytophthora infestans (strain T30-4) TaxID=403677 RepID=D0MVK9_PHYIT|nr:uncharacterized protein PITG_02140 [Phytophthora infestans T30-4]EEY63672.1 hypothetical protein PITG_02140 [Phytophthora infestans T30-4]|eukprot:XP_002907108.1 hypothetical protein PITG_02140 [Phytophthora infestans T30-4]